MTTGSIAHVQGAVQRRAVLQSGAVPNTYFATVYPAAALHLPLSREHAVRRDLTSRAQPPGLRQGRTGRNALPGMRGTTGCFYHLASRKRLQGSSCNVLSKLNEGPLGYTVAAAGKRAQGGAFYYKHNVELPGNAGCQGHGPACGLRPRHGATVLRRYSSWRCTGAVRALYRRRAGCWA